MKVLAIDPGNVQSGYVIWDGNSCLEKAIISNNDLISNIYKLHFDMCYIEMIACYGMPVGSSVFETCVWIGRFMQEIKNCKTDLVELASRKEVKMYWCQSNRAKDANVNQAIKDRFGDKGSKKNGYNPHYNDEHVKMKSHMWQALALAVYAYENEKPNKI